MTQVTSPDNIPSPDLTDQYALTQDMANLADGTQKALNRRANAYRGTSSSRIAFSSADSGVLWQDTDGIKMIWKRDGSSWVPAVWRWSGSVAQMNSFAQAPNGFEWADSSSGSTYRRRSGVWGLTQAAGRRTGISLPAGQATTISIQFPAAFSSAPTVLVASDGPTAWQPQPAFRALSVTTTGFTLQGFSSASRPDAIVSWVALS